MRYYYAAGGALRGPSTLDQLTELLAGGHLPASTSVWAEDGTGPTPLHDLVPPRCRRRSRRPARSSRRRSRGASPCGPIPPCAARRPAR